jgi:hypothetical protein
MKRWIEARDERLSTALRRVTTRAGLLGRVPAVVGRQIAARASGRFSLTAGTSSALDRCRRRHRLPFQRGGGAIGRGVAPR